MFLTVSNTNDGVPVICCEKELEQDITIVSVPWSVTGTNMPSIQPGPVYFSHRQSCGPVDHQGRWHGSCEKVCTTAGNSGSNLPLALNIRLRKSETSLRRRSGTPSMLLHRTVCGTSRRIKRRLDNRNPCAEETCLWVCRSVRPTIYVSAMGRE